MFLGWNYKHLIHMVIRRLKGTQKKSYTPGRWYNIQDLYAQKMAKTVLKNILYFRKMIQHSRTVSLNHGNTGAKRHLTQVSERRHSIQKEPQKNILYFMFNVGKNWSFWCCFMKTSIDYHGCFDTICMHNNAFKKSNILYQVYGFTLTHSKNCQI